MKKLDQAGVGALFVIVILVLVGGLGYYTWQKNGKPNPFKGANVTNFNECVAAGNPVQESYPEVCRSKDGRSFTNPEQVAE